MKTTEQLLTGLCLAALSLSAGADPLLRGPGTIAVPFQHADPAAPHKPLGIEGNGLLGIEGNGIVQRNDNGELVVNDTLYELGPGKVHVTIDASAASSAAIQPGHVVLAGARTPDEGQPPALAVIELDHLVRGPVETGGIDLDNDTVRVLGQELALADFVEIADASDEIKIDDLMDGDYLRVSGWLDAGGNVVVTRLERTLPLPATLETSGRVVALDEIGQTLQIGDLVVDYASAQFVVMDPAERVLGDRLEVVGNVVNGAGELSATRVRHTPAPLSGEDGQEVELQGYADQAIFAGQFVLAGQPVSVSGATVYERGVATDVQSGRLLEVEGVIGADGKLKADKVEFDEEVIESEIRIAGVVESVAPQTEQLGRFGLTVSAAVATRYEDKSGSATPVMSFANIEPGMFVELRGYDEPDGSNTVTASRITRDIEDVSTLRARVSWNDGFAIGALGLVMLTDTGTVYEDEEGNGIGEAQFIALAQVGVLIRATGTPVPGGIDVTQLEIE